MPAVKGQKYNIEPKKRMEKVLDIMAENGGVKSRAIIEAGYSKSVAKSPTKLTNTKGWQMLLEKKIKDGKLLRVLDEGLSAGKRVFKNNNETGEIEDVGVEADYAVRHKYLETGLKLKSRFPKEDNPFIALQVNVGEDRDKYR